MSLNFNVSTVIALVIEKNLRIHTAQIAHQKYFIYSCKLLLQFPHVIESYDSVVKFFLLSNKRLFTGRAFDSKCRHNSNWAIYFMKVWHRTLCFSSWARSRTVANCFKRVQPLSFVLSWPKAEMQWMEKKILERWEVASTFNFVRAPTFEIGDLTLPHCEIWYKCDVEMNKRFHRKKRTLMGAEEQQFVGSNLRWSRIASFHALSSLRGSGDFLCGADDWNLRISVHRAGEKSTWIYFNQKKSTRKPSFSVCTNPHTSRSYKQVGWRLSLLQRARWVHQCEYIVRFTQREIINRSG